MDIIKKILKALWRFKINFIRKYPIISTYIAFLEGIIIGMIIYHYFFMEKFSCCVELG
tara:strand:+ start:545 stop:718 length:174 start_codon:yes stop_codon:yes gene_type:complete